MNIKEKIEDLIKLMLSGKQMDAFEKYYHEDVVMQENSKPPMFGKSANREREIQGMQMIETFHGAQVHAVTPHEIVSGVRAKMERRTNYSRTLLLFNKLKSK